MNEAFKLFKRLLLWMVITNLLALSASIIYKKNESTNLPPLYILPVWKRATYYRPQSLDDSGWSNKDSNVIHSIRDSRIQGLLEKLTPLGFSSENRVEAIVSQKLDSKELLFLREKLLRNYEFIYPHDKAMAVP